MRKSVKIIIAIFSVMICLLVILSVTLSGTVAKYVTSGGDYSDSARVAKWGVTISTGSDLKSSYEKEGTIVVNASNSDKVFAPGMQGSILDFTVIGKPEVSYAVDISEPTFTIGNGYKAESRLIFDENGDNIEYFPIIIKLCKIDNKTRTRNVVASYGMVGTGASQTFNTVDELAEAVKDGMENLNDSFEPNADKNMTYALEWEWPYKVPQGNTHQTQYLDTVLGEALVNNKAQFNISASANFSAYQTQN